MAASFLVILFFGKRAGTKATAAIGIGAVSICLVFSVVVAGQWINRVNHPPTGAALAEDIRQANGLTPQTPEEIESEVNSASADSGETVASGEAQPTSEATAAEGEHAATAAEGEHAGEGEHETVPPVVRTV